MKMSNRKIYRMTGTIVAALVLTLSACGEERDTTVPPITVQSESSEPESVAESVESSTNQIVEQERIEESLTQENSSVEELPTESTASETSSENELSGESSENELSEEVSDEKPVENTTVMAVKYPITIKGVNPNGWREIRFDADGDILQEEYYWEYNEHFGKDEIIYAKDEQGNKIYGIVFDNNIIGQSSDTWTYGNASVCRIQEKPLIETINYYSDNEGDGLYESCKTKSYTYDINNRVVYAHKEDPAVQNSEIDINYTYTDQEGDLLISYVENDKLGSQDQAEQRFDSDGYLLSSTEKHTDEHIDDTFQNNYEYDTNHNMTVHTSYGYAAYNKYEHTECTYDEEGHLVNYISYDGDELISRIEYEGWTAKGDWEVSAIYSASGDLTYLCMNEYDDDEKIISTNCSSGNVSGGVRYHYDDSGKLDHVTAGDTIVYQFAYNEEGLLKSLEKTAELAEIEGNGIWLRTMVEDNLRKYIARCTDLDYCKWRDIFGYNHIDFTY